jgi:hypothetical protein
MDRGLALVAALTGLFWVLILADFVGWDLAPRWIALVALPSLIGGITWLLGRRPIVPTLAWVIGAWVALAFAYFAAPPPVDSLILAVVYGCIVALMFSARVGDAWLRLFRR